MGFEQVAALTHEMESVFELLRENKSGLDREAITILLSCLDALEAAMESIAADGEERLDPTLRSCERLPRPSSAGTCTIVGREAAPVAAPEPARPPNARRLRRRSLQHAARASWSGIAR